MKSMNEITTLRPKTAAIKSLEIICLSSTILVIVVISSSPIIAYSLNPPITATVPNISDMTNRSGDCSEAFYETEDGICRPLCHAWRQIDYITAKATRIVGGTSGICGIISAGVVLLGVLLQYKKMASVPSIFISYMALNIIILSIFSLLSAIFGRDLYCSSTDLVETLLNPSLYCKLSGVAFHYCFVLLSFFILCHIGIVCYKVSFPIHALAMSKLKRFRYVHISLLAIGVVLPVPGVLVILLSDDQYNMKVIPPLFCLPQGLHVFFYTYALVHIVISITYNSFLVAIIWIVHKHNNLFTPKKHWVKLSGTEKKLIFLFVLYFFNGISLNAYNLSHMMHANDFYNSLATYIICESSGSNTTCEIDGKYIDSNAYPNIFTSAFLVLIPLGQLVFIVNFKKLKEKICTAYLKLQRIFHCHNQQITESQITTKTKFNNVFGKSCDIA